MASCCSLVILSIIGVLTIIAFATPFWTTHGSLNSGLWAASSPKCTNDDCLWEFKSDWFKAVQALYTIGVCCVLLGFLLDLFAICRESETGIVTGALLIIGFVSMGVAITVYGAKQNGAGVEVSNGFGRLGKIFGWSFWLAVSTTVMTLVTGIFYICDWLAS